MTTYQEEDDERLGQRAYYDGHEYLDFAPRAWRRGWLEAARAAALTLRTLRLRESAPPMIPEGWPR